MGPLLQDRSAAPQERVEPRTTTSWIVAIAALACVALAAESANGAVGRVQAALRNVTDMQLHVLTVHDTAAALAISYGSVHVTLSKNGLSDNRLGISFLSHSVGNIVVHGDESNADVTILADERALGGKRITEKWHYWYQKTSGTWKICFM